MLDEPTLPFYLQPNLLQFVGNINYKEINKITDRICASRPEAITATAAGYCIDVYKRVGAAWFAETYSRKVANDVR
ncbi:MAG: hypothetical protein DDT36_01268 [Firmicutes bacterium]|nr:hypothetical protein [Bacillota bacterium]